MNLLHLMLITCVLLAQVWPAQAVSVMAERKTAVCTQGCCAWLAEAGMSVCDCDETSAPAAPSSLPPAGARERVPQVVWVESRDESLSLALPRKDAGVAAARCKERDAAVPPHVRLPVLFCSFLN